MLASDFLISLHWLTNFPPETQKHRQNVPGKPRDGGGCLRHVLYLCRSVVVQSLPATRAKFGDSTKLDKIGGNWLKLGLMRVAVAVVVSYRSLLLDKVHLE